MDLFANYFEIGGVNDLQLHEYQVHFREDNISLRVRRRLFTLLLLQPPLLNENVATNYVDKIISTKELKCVDFNLRYNEENESVSHVYQLVLAYVRVHRIGEVLEDINSPVGTYDKDERNMAIQAMNMAVARYPNFGRRIQFVGQSRHFFLETGNEKFFLGGGLEARRGFFHSVKTSTGRLLLNLNVSTAAFYRAGRLIQVAEEAVPLHIARKDNREAHRLDRFLRKLRISTTHGKTSRARTITEIALLETGVAAMPSQVKFYWAQGSPPRNVTVSDYFEKRRLQRNTPFLNYSYRANVIVWSEYNVKVIPQQIVVNIGSQANPCYIPAEFCSVLEGQVARQRLRPDQTSAMIKIACRPPGINALDISTRGRELMGIGKPEGPVSLSHVFFIFIEVVRP